MKKRSPISKIMSSDIVTVNHTNTLLDVHKLIKEKGIHHVPVVSGEKLIGLISHSDLERVTFVKDYGKEEISTQLYGNLTIEQVMTKELTCVQKDDTIRDVAITLGTNSFHALPVLNGENIVGIVTTKDLLKYMIEQF